MRFRRATTAAAGAAPGAPAAPGDAARKPGAGAGAPASPDGDADGLGNLESILAMLGIGNILHHFVDIV